MRKPSSPFCIEVDEQGRVIAREHGSPAAADPGLIETARRLIGAQISAVSFLWAPSARGAVHEVEFSLRRHADGSMSANLAAAQLDEMPFGLTRRELDVVTLLAVGLSNATIAARTMLSVRTVTTHIGHIIQKLGVDSRTAVAAIAFDAGMLTFPFPGAPEDVAMLALGRALHEDADSLEAVSRDRARAGLATFRSRRLVGRRPLIVGAAMPLSGDTAFDGEEMLNASRLAIEEINQRGGVDGRPVELQVADVDILDAESVRRGFTTITDQEPDVVVSGYLAHQDAAHEIVADTGSFYLHAATLAAMERRVSEDPSRYGRIFQVCPSDSHYAPRFVAFMEELRASGRWLPSSRRLVVIQSGWDLTDLGLAEAAAAGERAGWQLEVIRPAGESPLAWAAVAEEIRAGEPGAVMIGHYLVPGTLAFLDAFLENPSDTLVYALYSPSVPQFRERLGARGDGLLWATVTGTYSDPLASSFAARYAQRFGRAPGRSHAGISYDRVQLIAQAWRLSGNPRDRDAVARELRGLVYRGVNGAYYFGDEGQSAKTYTGSGSDPSLSLAHLVFQIQGGAQRILDPQPYADAVFLPPPWLTRTRLSLHPA